MKQDLEPAPVSTEKPSAPAGRFLLLWLGTVVLLAVTFLPALDLLLLPWPGAAEVEWPTRLWRSKLSLARAAPPGPRLLLIGGSAGHFSVDAELLEARLGTPVFNLATHAGLGLHFLLENAREAARPGDTVLLYLEDAQYRESELSDFALKNIWTARPERLFRLPTAVLWQQLYEVPMSEYGRGWARRNEAMRKVVGPADMAFHYPILDLGPRGDQRGYVKPKEPRATKPNRLEKGVVSDCGREIDRFIRWARDHEVHLLAALPGTMGTAEDEPRLAEGIAVLDRFYRQRNIPFLRTPATALLPQELMLDTRYHASAAGRRIVTETLAGPLAAALRITLPAAEPGTLLVAGAQSGQGRELVLARNGPARCRWLGGQALTPELGLTPTAVSEAVARGGRFLTADPAVRTQLEAVGLSGKVIESKAETLAGWVSGFPSHLFVLAATPGFDTRPLRAGLPEPFASFLADPAAHKVALFGTGPYANIRLSRSGGKPVELLLPEKQPWQKGWIYPFAIALSSGAPEDRPEIILGHLPIEHTAGPGLRVAVLDPAAGRLVRRGTFTGPTLPEWELTEVMTHALP